MNKSSLRRTVAAALCWLLLPPSSAFAQIKINQLPIGAVSGSYVTICDNLTTTYACTYNQVAAWFNANLNLILPTQTGLGGDCLGTNGTVASWVACGGSAVFNAITSGTNTNALTMGTGGVLTTSGTGIINANEVNGVVVPASAAVLASNSSSQATALTLATNLAVASGVLETTQPINAQGGTSYAVATTDAGKLLTFSNASAIGVTLSQATTAGFTSGFSFDVEALGAGLVTITPTTSTINGASTLIIPQNAGCTITSDGANYQVSACTAIDNSMSIGTKFTLASGTGGCATSGTLVGGPTAGKFNCTGTAGASTIVINLPTAPNGWTCSGSDLTDSLTLIQSASAATSCTVKVTTGSNPATLSFLAIGY